MSNPRKQHYVPQVYLKAFAMKGRQSHIFVLSKRKKRIFPSNIDSVAAERDFYTLKNGEDKYVWETTYSQTVEPMLATILKELIKRSSNLLIQEHAVVLSQEEKIKLALSIVFFYFVKNS